MPAGTSPYEFLRVEPGPHRLLQRFVGHGHRWRCAECRGDVPIQQWLSTESHFESAICGRSGWKYNSGKPDCTARNGCDARVEQPSVVLLEHHELDAGKT